MASFASNNENAKMRAPANADQLAFVPVAFSYINMMPDDFTEWVKASKQLAQDENNRHSGKLAFTFPKLDDAELVSLCDKLNSAMKDLRNAWRLSDTYISPSTAINIRIEGGSLRVIVLQPAYLERTNDSCNVSQVIADTSRPVMSYFPHIGAGNSITDYAIYIMLSVSWELISLGEIDINIDNWTFDPFYNPLFGAMRLHGSYKDIGDGWSKICENAMFTSNRPTLWSYIMCSRRYELERQINDSLKDIMRWLVHMVDADRTGVDGSNDIRASFLMTTLPFFSAVMARREPFTYNAMSFITGMEPETFGIKRIDEVDYSLHPFECEHGTWPEKITADMNERDGWVGADLPQDALPYNEAAEITRVGRVVAAAAAVWKTIAVPEADDDVKNMISDWLLDESVWERDLGFLAKELSIPDAIELAQYGVPVEDIIA